MTKNITSDNNYNKLVSKISETYISGKHIAVAAVNQKGATLSHKLTWSHYVELLKIDDKQERSFYEKQSLIEKQLNEEGNNE